MDRAAGLNGVSWFAGVVVIGVFCWIFRALVARGTQILCALILTLLAAATSMNHLLARPHILSWLFSLVYFLILDATDKGDATKTERRRLWLLPVIMILWVNLHGGFVVGLMLIGVYWVSSIVPPLEGGEPRVFALRARTKQLTWIGIACAGVTLVNPYGWRLHASIYTYLTNPFYAAHVGEMQSPDFHGLAQQCFLVITCAAYAGTGRYPLRARYGRVSCS